MKRIALLPSLLVLAACSRDAPPPVAPATPAPAVATKAPASSPPSATTAKAIAPAPEPPSADQATPTLAHWDGYGDLRFGMAPAAARTAWGGELAGDATDVLAQCGYLHPTWARPRIGFMFENARLVRYDIDTPKETAPGGGRVGMARARIEALYPGRVEARPHHYVQGAYYLRVRDAQVPDRALVFETDAQGTVLRWRVGVAPAVDYIEGCS